MSNININKYCTLVNTTSVKPNKYLISVSLFYLKTSYKNVYKYINGLNRLVLFIDKYKTYTLRIYYDDSIFDNEEYTKMLDLFKKNTNIELINYKCSHFLIDNYHIGTFGMLMRFLCLFEKSNYDVIYISDIDEKNYEWIEFIIKKIINYPQKIFITSVEDYNLKYLDAYNNKFNMTALSNIFVKNYRFDIKIFTDYNFLN